jgi:sec-independent protein translocase protein TatA
MPELVIILVIVLLLFGAKKIPELARGLGGGIKNYKNALKDDEKTEAPKNIEADKPTQTTAAPDTTKTV